MLKLTVRQIRVPSKKNRYAVMFSRAFDKATLSIRNKLRQYNQRIAWISPTKAVKDAEETIGWFARAAVKKPVTGPVRLEIAVLGKGSVKDLEIAITELDEGSVSRRQGDLDGILTTVMDGLQKWPLKDDSQVADVRIWRKK